MTNRAEVTIRDLVHLVHRAATELGIDLAPKDTAFIISTFLEGISQSEPHFSGIDAWLQSLADEVSKVRNEG